MVSGRCPAASILLNVASASLHRPPRSYAVTSALYVITSGATWSSDRRVARDPEVRQESRRGGRGTR
eukprot:3433286-Pyramimonas_sp.AAC.1